MRISTSMQFSRARAIIQQRQQQLALSERALSTGQRVSSVADDPVASRKILREESVMREIQAHRRSAQDVEFLLADADTVMGEMNNALERALELAIQLGNDTYSAADRQTGADEVLQVRQRLIELGNSKRSGRSLFAGLGNMDQPFDSQGNFLGDFGVLRVPVGRGAEIEATVVGGAPLVDTDGTSTFGVLTSLETALRADNGDAIRNAIDGINEAIDRVSTARQTVGHRLERLANVQSALERAELAAEATFAVERDTDFAEAVLQLQESQNGLQSALQVTTTLNDLNLLSFLG